MGSNIEKEKLQFGNEIKEKEKQDILKSKIEDDKKYQKENLEK